MPASPASPGGPAPDLQGYVRGAGGVRIPTGRLAGVMAAICVVVLVAIGVDLTVAAAHRSAQLSTLRHQGVPVQVTVTGCLGIGSGVGMGIEYWQCRGSYSLGGQSYTEVIRGSRSLLDAGQKLPAIAVPGQPSLVSTVSSAAKPPPGLTPYVVPALLAVAAIAILVGWVLLSRRRRSRSDGRQTVTAAVG